MSDTPRCDDFFADSRLSREVVEGFACTLEREVAALKAERDALRFAALREVREMVQRDKSPDVQDHDKRYSHGYMDHRCDTIRRIDAMIAKEER